MYLKSIEISNWKSIEKLSMKLEDLMVFIGQANSGKSSIFSAILFFLNERNFRPIDPKDSNKAVEIKGIFQLENIEKIRKLKPYLSKGESIHLIIRVVNKKSLFFIRKGTREIEIAYKGYNKITSEIDVIFIPSVATTSVQLTEFFYKKILHILEKEDTLQLVDVEKINHTYSCLKEEYASKGLQRNALFNICRILSKYSKDNRRSVLGNALILYEEPELYLHPQAERELFSSLIKLSKLGTQVYICTHSSVFVDIKNYSSICIVRRDDKGTHVFQERKELFSKDEVKEFNMNYWINPDRSELFFAKKVILVEGQTDKIVIPYLAKQLGVYKYDYSIIECGSKSTLPQYIKLLNNFHIPYTVIYDRDEHGYRTELEITTSKRKNRELQRLVNRKIGEYIEFDNDIEEEIGVRLRKGYKNKPYTALKTVMNKNYKPPKSLKEKILKAYY